MRFAYADPPYIGQARKLYGYPETDHAELVREIERYDGWALSMSAAMYSLKEIIALAPEDARLAAWVKPFSSYKPGIDPAYTWEPVLYKTVRKASKNTPTVKDHLICNITLKKGLCGAKPREFCFWLFDLLGMQPGDELVDIFPGTGIVGLCWSEMQKEPARQLELAN